MWGNDVFEWLYENLEQAYQAGEDYIVEKANTVTDSITASFEWIWEALQGDFNAELSTGQIAANAVLGLIPIVDQILDLRDLIANCRELNKDINNKFAWIALVFTLIGLIPSLGSAVKGVLKILFLFVRKMGGNVVDAIKFAMKPILSFLENPKVVKILGDKNIIQTLIGVIDSIKQIKGKISANTILDLLNSAVKALEDLVSSIKSFAPDTIKAWLTSSVKQVKYIQSQADKFIEPVIKPVQDMLDQMALSLQKQVDELQAPFPALANGRVIHQLDDDIVDIDPRLIKTNKHKGLYGEIISDHFMVNRNFKNLLADDRIPRNLESIPRGRGIDGIYENLNPPPPFVITETKFRTDSGKYVDSDGIARSSVLPTTKGTHINGRHYPASKQMSDDWLEPRLADELNRQDLIKLEEGYERWLMIVDESGEVVNITKLDEFANSIEKIL